MKKCVRVLMVGLVAFTAFGILVVGAEEKKGPFVDKVYVNVKMQEEIGLKDAAEGLTDIFFYGVEGPVIKGLDQATLDKLDLYTVPGGRWSLIFNPIPNQAPYLVKVQDKEYFNPYAIREIRYAMNYLINRKYIVDEILFGAGTPAFTPATEGQPGTYKYNLVAGRMGLTAEGDETKAIADMTAAMETAAALPELKGRLVKDAQWWTFDKEPILIKFLIRVDDPQGRLKEGEYVSQQIEKAGLKVERLLWDRAKCSAAVYRGNPANYEWHIYTEGWGAGATRAFWEHIISQNYAPWYGQMPGANNAEFWNYKQDEIDQLTRKAYSGNFLTEDEYWQLVTKATEIGLKEAVRVQIANQNQYFAANKARFKNRMLYGVGDGLNEWSFMSANMNQENVLKVTGFSAKGSLFMYAWDPIGEGFRDVYAQVCAQPTGMQSTFESPVTAINTPLLANPSDIQTTVHQNDKGDVVGDIAVPAAALKYDTMKNAWVPVGDGVTAMSKTTYTFTFGKWHQGQPMTIADVMYAEAFRQEWAVKDGDNDPDYNAGYASEMEPQNKTIKGYMLNPDGTITTYFDYNFPASKERTANWGAPALALISGRPGITVSWEIIEAVAQLVADKSASGTKYALESGDNVTEVDVLVPSIVADIKAKLEEFKAAKYVPDSIKDYVKPEDAVARYDAAIKWIDAHGHAMIGCGPFYIDKYNPTDNYMELTAFRDYPFSAEYWAKKLAATMVQIDSVDVPAMFAAQEKNMTVKVNVSEVAYPDGTSKPAEKGEVSVMVVTPNEELSYKAEYKEAGVFEAVIPVEKLEPGSYTLLIDAKVEGAIPNATAATTVIY